MIRTARLPPTAVVLLAAFATAQTTQTLPRGLDVTLGNSSTSFPFNNTNDHTWQWHYDSAQFDMQAPIEILDVGIRADSGTSLAYDFPSVEVVLVEASTDYVVGAHDAVFAQIAAGLLMPVGMQVGCCDIDSSMTITVIDALGMAQDSAGLPVTLTCP